MTDRRSVTVAVVSHGRPEGLQECLTALETQSPNSVIVVADRASLASVSSSPLSAVSHVIPFDTPNISMARNLALQATYTDLIAFIDDDALPSANWLNSLIEPFGRPKVMASTGFVRHHGGPRWQFRGEVIDSWARVTSIPPPQETVTLEPPKDKQAVVTIGTNCAFDVACLADIGGFDEGFRYFLDEADVNMRLAARGARTALVPHAIVDHYPAASQHRRSDGVLRDQTEIGASLEYFIRKYADAQDCNQAWELAKSRQMVGIIRAMIKGQVEPRDVHRARSQLEKGRQLADIRRIGE
ncbi:MAG: glycosyltransferase [Pseudomonadota bacterium]